MSPFELRFKPSVEKDLRSLPVDVRLRVLERIRQLGEEPLPRGSVKLAGSDHLHRIRVGDYRIIYEVDSDGRLVTVHYVRHRREAYRTR